MPSSPHMRAWQADRRFRLHLAFLVCLSAPIHFRLEAAPIEVTNEKDKIVLNAFLGHARKEVAGLTKEHFAAITIPEKLCWIDFPKMNMALTAYEFTGDKQYLRDFTGAMNNLMAVSRKGPDGFEGWYGEPDPSLKDPDKPDVVISEIQTDFRAAATISRFADIVEIEPELKKEFGPDLVKYLNLAENHLVKKWDSSFVELGDRGGVYRWNKEYKPGVAAMSLPQEKLAFMIDGLLGLYRTTGNVIYAEKAAKLGLWFKSCLEYDGTRYSWNRWNPAGDWDVSPTNPAKWTSWIAKEPKGIWHSASVGSAVQLYNHGLVFNREDIVRLLKTQIGTCWNGDLENPLYFTVDGKPAKDGEIFSAASLCPFDEKFARLNFEGKAQDVRVAKSGSSWHGGVIASDWLVDKYILRNSEAPRYSQAGAEFMRQADPSLVKQLSFSPTPPGYQTPLVPTPEALASMKP